MTDPLPRRSFLRDAAVAVAAVAVPGAITLGADAVFPIIDTHQHLWDLTKFKLPWLKEGAPLHRDFSLDDYRKAAELKDNAQIVKTVYMEVDVTPAQQQAEVDAVVALCKRADSRMVGAVVSGRPASEGFAAYVKPFRDSAYVKGVRRILHAEETPAGTCLDKEFVKGVRLLGDMNLTFDLCMRAGELTDGAKLADACPDTRFVLDHCGNPDVQAKDLSAWKRDLADLAKRKNVACKVSGVVESAPKEGRWKADDLAPVVNHVLDSFGPDRVLFASNWPVCLITGGTLARWVDALRSIVRERKTEEQRKLFHDNALRVYRLD